MSENMILSDEKFISSLINDSNYKYNLEGKNGKHALSMLMSKMGDNYKETKHGPKYLKSIRLSRCALSSPSANDFHSDLQAAGIECWWI